MVVGLGGGGGLITMDMGIHAYGQVHTNMGDYPHHSSQKTKKFPKRRVTCKRFPSQHEHMIKKYKTNMERWADYLAYKLCNEKGLHAKNSSLPPPKKKKKEKRCDN